MEKRTGDAPSAATGESSAAVVFAADHVPLQGVQWLNGISPLLTQASIAPCALCERIGLRASQSPFTTPIHVEQPRLSPHHLHGEHHRNSSNISLSATE